MTIGRRQNITIWGKRYDKSINNYGIPNYDASAFHEARGVWHGEHFGVIVKEQTVTGTSLKDVRQKLQASLDSYLLQHYGTKESTNDTKTNG